MGNVLESDASVTSDTETKDILRTAGDGMESETVIRNGAIVMNENDTVTEALHGDAVAVTRGSKADLSKSKPVSKTTEMNPCEVPNSPDFVLLSNGLLLDVEVCKPSRASPNQLPPREKLIPIKPPKPPRDILPSFVLEKPIGVAKQKNPKFVPYEPYAGATRPIVPEQIPRTHSRQPSSNGSVVSDCSLPQGPILERMHSSQCDLKEDPGTHSNDKSKRNSKPNSDDPNHPAVVRHSETLLKERLKMAEKDLNELQKENAKLKKLLVNTMSGSTGDMRHGSYKRDSFCDDSETSHIIAESMSQLNNEIEVWRSKFLSSCVLVEQLSKENQQLTGHISKASQIFRDMKKFSSMTPGLYEQSTKWLQQTAVASSSSTTAYPLVQDCDTMVMDSGAGASALHK